jgi:hypothetical protein
MLTVIWVRKKEREANIFLEEYDVSNDIDVLLKNNLLTTRASFIQAMCYLLVYCLKTLIYYFRVTSGLGDLSRGWQIFHCVTNPLDGFFNALIYLSIEVHNLRMAEASRDGQKPSRLEALRRVIKQGDASNVAVISHLSIVRDDTEAIVHVREDDGRITESKFSVKGSELEDFFHSVEREYIEEDRSNSSNSASISEKHDHSSVSPFAPDESFNDDNLSYPSNNFSSGTTLSPNVSIVQENTENTRRRSSVVMDQYQELYVSKHRES